MNKNRLLLIIVFALIAPLTAFAETPGLSETTTEAGVYTESREIAQEREMKHEGRCGRKGKGGGKHGGGRHGKHDEVVQRLDMIEARIAKIELMLESLMKRR